MVGSEQEPPYDKPPLSKQYLEGSFDAARLSLLTEQEAAKAGVELRLGMAAVDLDVSARQVGLADGSRLSYDVCVVATGASARPSPWLVASGVHVLRTREDSDAIRKDLVAQARLVVVGGGFIGAEVAATARTLGAEVTVVDPLDLPVGRVVGDEVGALLTQVHPRHGVATRFGVGVESIDSSEGRLLVALTDGSTLAATTVVVGIGATPNAGWLASSGLAVDDGVLCDEYCRAVDAKEVFAAGDVARWRHPRHGEHIRVEHWTNAVEQAACVAHNIAHPEELRKYEPVEYVWSDQYDWTIQIAGSPAGAGAPLLVGDPDAARGWMAALYPDARNRLAAAVALNWPRASVECRRLIAAGAGFPAALLAVEALAGRRRGGGR